MPIEETVYVIDQILPKAGQGEVFFNHYMDAYAPVARQRGLMLDQSLVHPPVWLEGPLSNTLLFIWSVSGTGGYWGAEAKARWDDTSSHFWRGIEPMIISRTRQVFSKASDIASLTNV